VQTAPTTAAPPSKATTLAAERANTLSHYDKGQRDAVLRLYNLARVHLGTSGGNTAAKLLLSLYNGNRFQFDLTAMRGFDVGNLEAAFTIMLMDATRTYCEVHEIIDAILGVSTTGAQFEVWAYDLRMKGRCTKEGYLNAKKWVAA
jgi:hypothetical protein